ncbi:MAG: hypothetical protein C4560_07620 [Nitrospiraceae bacterium]|nr:MAG: hypothetical protein C4560_07620 [Nitrospiraceae bacterium]
MKILITNTTLCNFYGSQTFTYALARELKQKGHKVFCFTTQPGNVAERLEAEGIPVATDMSKIPDDIDIIHAHHRHESLLAFAGFRNTPMIMACHGVLPWQEQPLKSRMNIVRFVAVSEEVRDHLISNHGLTEDRISIIRNGIDLRRFCSIKPINNSLKNILFLSNHSSPEPVNVIRQVCEEKGIGFERIGFPTENVWNVEDHINGADLVVTLGRGVLEAAACKRLVVVYDYNGADGLVTKENFAVLRKRNFSGRTNRLRYTVEEFSKVIEQYDPKIAGEVYRHVPEHDLVSIAEQYVGLYEEAVKAFNKQPLSFVKVSSNLFRGINELIGDFRSQMADQNSALVQAKARAEQLAAELRKREGDVIEVKRLLDEKTASLELFRWEVMNSSGTGLIDEFKTRCLDIIARDTVLSELERRNREIEEQNSSLKDRLGNMDVEQKRLEEELKGTKEQIEKLGQQLKLGEEQLRQMKAGNEQKGEKIKALEAVVNERDVSIRQLREDLARKEEHIRQRYGEIGKLREDINARDRELMKLRFEQSEEQQKFGEEIRRSNEKIAALLAKVRQVETDLSEGEKQTGRLKEIIADEEQIRQRYAGALKKYEETITSYETAFSEMERLEAQMREKDARVFELLDSQSWKITAPLRAGHGLLLKIRKKIYGNNGP